MDSKMNNISPISHVECCDNMEFMKQFPDDFFDLAPVDIPYGIKQDGRNNHTRGKLARSKDYRQMDQYDNVTHDDKYFTELFRISKNQIIWGANHFISKIPYDSSCWLVWDKKNGETDFADCELAWTSFKTAVRIFTFQWQGMIQGYGGNKKKNEIRIHPNQKPVALYAWQFEKLAKPGFKIIDTNMGSQSSRIAAFKLGLDFWGCEIDPFIFESGCERFERECHGIIECNDGSKLIQQKLFI
jgi:site-specific DNA-methyltransferase (adenine-specific)